MTGIFDSGEGGRCALDILRRQVPREDLVFLMDRANAPYGTKSKEEIANLAEGNIMRLVGMGCERVLIACCTAGTVYPMLSGAARAFSLPIIEVTAKGAKEVSRGGEIAVISTLATARSHAFKMALSGFSVTEFAAQDLVGYIDDGECDGSISPGVRDYLFGVISGATTNSTDTLILGCTHFHAVRGEIEKLLKEMNKDIKIVSSAEEGALAMASEINCHSGAGKTIYI